MGEARSYYRGAFFPTMAKRNDYTCIVKGGSGIIGAISLFHSVKRKGLMGGVTATKTEDWGAHAVKASP